MNDVRDSVRASYDSVAAAYVEHLFSSVEREPYQGAEYQSRRCYLFARAASLTERQE